MDIQEHIRIRRLRIIDWIASANLSDNDIWSLFGVDIKDVQSFRNGEYDYSLSQLSLLEKVSTKYYIHIPNHNHEKIKKIMKYSERIAQTEEQKALSKGEFDVRSANIQFQKVLLEKEQALDIEERRLENLKNQIPLQIMGLVASQDNIDMLKREIKIIKSLHKELF